MGLTGLVARGARAHAQNSVALGYGPLQPTASRNTQETLLALPEGFTYTVLGARGSTMSDGIATPPDHDGMAAFLLGGKIRLLRNHEVDNKKGTAGAAIVANTKTYDPTAAGGVTCLVIDPETRQVERDFLALAGTLKNCAGGPMPWGTWLTCEETYYGAVVHANEKDETVGGFDKPHGYLFEVPVVNNTQTLAQPLKAMGRFVHEAIAVDPSTGIVYLTEDRKQAGFYRFIPNTPARLADGGKLEMLAITSRPNANLRKTQTPLQPLPCHWVEIEDADPDGADTYAFGVYDQGHLKGGATFARLEGCWQGNGYIYLNATSGGDQQLGQVWRYRPLGLKRGELTLLFESTDPKILNMPDNLCVTPRGGLLVCEDNEGSVQYLRGLTAEGTIFDFARNIHPKFPGSEFAGACYSPDGETLFVNLQEAGVTLAIWGPWYRSVL
jgi:uncharacterized protein